MKYVRKEVRITDNKFAARLCRCCLWGENCNNDLQSDPCEHYTPISMDMNGYEDDLDHRHDDYQDIIDEYN